MMSNSTSPSLIVSCVTHRDVKGELALAVDAGPPCSFRLEGIDGLHDVCTLALPEDAQEISVTGEISYLPWREKSTRREIRGTQRWPIVDLSPLIGILRDTGRPFGQRLCEFEAAAHLSQQIATGQMKGIDFLSEDGTAGAARGGGHGGAAPGVRAARRARQPAA